MTGQQVVLAQTFPGPSSSLSLDISSLPQCMSYTVSVTASNTGGSTTAEAKLSKLSHELYFCPTPFIYMPVLQHVVFITSDLNPLVSLEVSCVAGENGCYLETSCLPNEAWSVRGCRLDYSDNNGSTLTFNHNSNVSIKVQIPCDNLTISYNRTAYDSMLRELPCTDSGMTRCHPKGGKVYVTTYTKCLL